MRKELYKRRFSLLLAFMMIFQMTVSPFSGSFVYADENTEPAPAVTGETSAEAAGEDMPECAEESPVAEASAPVESAVPETGSVDPYAVENTTSEVASFLSGSDDFEEVARGEGAETFEVTFYEKDNSTVADKQIVPKGAYATDPHLVTEGQKEIVGTEKKVFKYWRKSPGSGKFDFENTPITASVNLFQYWNNYYTVTFIADNKPVSSQDIEKDSTASPPDYTREDYELLGWFEDVGCTTPYLFGSVNNDHSVYSKWIECVTFDVGAEAEFTDTHETTKSLSVNLDKTVRYPNKNLLKKDYSTFLGWFTDKKNGPEWIPTDPVNAPMTLYAHWKFDTFTVSFQDAQGSELAPKQTIEAGSKVDFTSIDITIPENYTFDAWYIKNTNTKWTDPPIFSDYILVPKFKEIEYSVVFDPGKYGTTKINNGDLKEVIQPGTVSQGGYIKPPKTPEYKRNPPKYIFTDWYTDENYAKGTSWNFATRKVKESDAKNGIITLYAGWRIKTFTVSFDVCSTRVPKPADITNIEYGSNIEKPVVPRIPDEAIENWYINADYSGTPFVFGNKGTEVTKDITLYAHWTAAKTVSFDRCDGSPLDSIQVISGNTIDDFDKIVPIREGYIFKGWYKDSVQWKASDVVNDNLTLSANWELKKFDVVFLNEGVEYTKQQNVSFDELIKEPKRPDDTVMLSFNGWYWEKDPTVSWDFANRKMPDLDTVLYEGDEKVLKLNAKWIPLKYKVSFNTALSTCKAIPGYRMVEYNSTVEPPVLDVTPNDKEIRYWYYVQDNKKIEWKFNTDKVTNDITLYAEWKTKLYMVRFLLNKNDTSSKSIYQTQQVSYNGLVTRPKNDPPNMTIDDAIMKFDNWYYSGTAYDFSKPITSNFDIYAGWKTPPSYIIYIKLLDKNGKVTPAGPVSLAEGQSKEFSVSPNLGYEISTVSVGNTAIKVTDNKFTVENIKANTTVTVSFKKKYVKTYTITANSAEANGQVLPAGEREYEEGNSPKYIFEAFEGYVLDFIEVDGTKTVITGNYYIFDTLSSNHTLLAHFKKKSIVPPIPPGYHEVKFVVGTETVSSVTVSNGAVVERPEDPAIKGKIFQGWFDGNSKWNFSNAVTKDLTLTAKFLSETVSEGDVHSGLDDRMNISDPNDITMVKGQTYKFGEGIWSTTDSSVISVGKRNGIARAKNPSNIRVTITDSSRVPAVSYKIKVLDPEISDKSLTMGVGAVQKISLLYADGLNVAWTSSNPKIASVVEGVISTKSKGNVKIYAWANGKKYPCSVKVTDTFTAPSDFDNVTSFALRPTQTLNLRNVSIAGQKPNKLDWRLTDEAGSRDVNHTGWLAWDDGVCRVDVNGKLKAKACGTSILIGRQGDTRVKSIRVTVETIPSKTETYINVGKNEKLSYYKVVNSKAHWDATNLGEIVKLGNSNSTKGRVYGLAAGTSVVTCSYNGMVYQTTVHVENPVLAMEDNRIGRLKENQYVLSLKTGKRFMLDMPEVTQQVVWTSSDKNIAFVDEFGMVEGRKAGNAWLSTKINGTTVKVKAYITE